MAKQLGIRVQSPMKTSSKRTPRKIFFWLIQQKELLLLSKSIAGSFIIKLSPESQITFRAIFIVKLLEKT